MDSFISTFEFYFDRVDRWQIFMRLALSRFLCVSFRRCIELQELVTMLRPQDLLNNTKVTRYSALAVYVGNIYICVYMHDTRV